MQSQVSKKGPVSTHVRARSTRLTCPTGNRSEHQDAPLVQKRNRVDFDIGTHPLGNFVKHYLECIHGEVGLNSQIRRPSRSA